MKTITKQRVVTNALRTTAVASALFATLGVNAAETSFSMNGYLKSGILMTSDGTRGEVVGIHPATDRKFRLGNEQNTKIELLPTMKMTTDSGVWAKVRANLTHESVCTADWNCVGEVPVQYREGYVEIGNLPFAPNAIFWAGKRYSSSNTSNHQYDWEYIQYNGTGGGVDKVDVGFAKMDIGVYAFTPDGENAVPPVDKELNGYPEDYSVNLWLKSLGGTGFDLNVNAHMMANNEWRDGAAESGVGSTLMYNFDGFYGVAGGYSRIAYQYGKGLASGDTLGKNGWGWANLDETQSHRIVFDGVVNAADNVEVSTFAYAQKDTDFREWSGSAQGWDRELYAIGFRPHHQIIENFAMQYELGYEYRDENQPGNEIKGGLVKATIAPTITFESGFWSRPQLRFFATYAKWDDGVKQLLEARGYRNGTDTLNFGVQAEVWF
jgi:sucrose porin